MKLPYGYCDLRVDRVNDQIVDAMIQHGYSWIAVNTAVDCSLIGVGSSNRKKRKHGECNDENNEEKDWVPTPKVTNNNDSKLNILYRLTIQITSIGQLQKILSSRNFKLYHILAVEPLNDKVLQDLINSPSVDIIVCNQKTNISRKDYSVAVEKNIYFEVTYGQMLMNSALRQETITLAHLLHIKGKSKNVIVSSGAANKFDVRNPHDVINLNILNFCLHNLHKTLSQAVLFDLTMIRGFLLGLSKKQSKESITQGCHSVILKSYGRKLGKTAIHIVPISNTTVKKS